MDEITMNSSCAIRTILFTVRDSVLLEREMRRRKCIRMNFKYSKY